MSVLLGCIADDFTGATDLASFLVASGMRTVQLMGAPTEPVDLSEADAVVIALKSRTQATQTAVADSLQALSWLQQHDCQQYYFKYCSTFDSTAQGNIGPVADALLAALGETFTIACPSLPVNGRTVYNGYLFVNGVLLNESGMEHHPLTPMRDANLVRVLGAQTDAKVGLVDHTVLAQGVESTRQQLTQLAQEHRYAIVDTLDRDDLVTIGHACSELKLLTGGSGLAIGLADNFEAKGLFSKSLNSAQLSPVAGDAVVLSGSCSKATREQVAVFQADHPSLKIDPLLLHNGLQSAEQVERWFIEHRDQGPVLIYATDHPDAIKRSQADLGVEAAGELVEQLMADVVKRLDTLGVTKFIVAGGETSGSVVQALSVSALKIGPSIAAGVPLTQTLGSAPKLLALKSGNFGDKDFFAKALEMMP
ncbi:MAG: 3-oxo-tetronate kinase [Motiliproteus sp.]